MGDDWEIPHKTIECIPLLYVVEQCLYGNPCTRKTRRAVHDLAIHGNHADNLRSFLGGHVFSLIHGTKKAARFSRLTPLRRIEYPKSGK